MEGDLKNRASKGIMWSSVNHVSLIVMNFVIGIVMARLLSPADYGIAAIPAIFISIAEVFIESGFSQALVRKDIVTDDDLSTSFYYSICVGCFCYLLLFVSAPLLAVLYDEPVLCKLIRVSSLAFLWSPLNTPQHVILQRRLDFKTPALISIVTKIVAGCFGILLAYNGLGLWALVLANIASSALGTVQTWLVVRWYPRSGWSRSSFSYLWGYGNNLVLSRLISKIAEKLPSLILGKLFGPGDLGYYSKARSFSDAPRQLCSNVLSSVSFPVLSKVRDDDSVLNQGYRKMIRCSSFVVFPMMLLIAALARPIVILTLTEKWEACALLLQVLCVGNMWLPMNVINLNLLGVKGRTDLTLKLEIIKRPICLLFVLVGASISVVAMCCSEVLYIILALFLNTYYTKKLIGLSITTQFIDVLPSLILSICTFILVSFIINLFPSLLCQLLVGLIAGMFFYIGVACILRFKELADVKHLLFLRKAR